MVLHQAQKIIANDTHRFRVLCSGRRTGKTFLSVVEMIGKAIGTEKWRDKLYSTNLWSSKRYSLART